MACRLLPTPLSFEVPSHIPRAHACRDRRDVESLVCGRWGAPSTHQTSPKKGFDSRSRNFTRQNPHTTPICFDFDEEATIQRRKSEAVLGRSLKHPKQAMRRGIEGQVWHVR